MRSSVSPASIVPRLERVIHSPLIAIHKVKYFLNCKCINAHIALAIAIAGEVIATTALKSSESFTKLVLQMNSALQAACVVYLQRGLRSTDGGSNRAQRHELIGATRKLPL